MIEKHARITEEMVERTRSRIGEVFVPREPYYNTGASKDTIRHFVLGIGDQNPLWVDEAYAGKTRYGCIVAPPCFLYSVYWPDAKGACFPGIHGWHAGNDWEFFRPIRVNNSFTIKDMITDLVEKKKSEMAKRTFIGYCTTTYTNQEGNVVAVAKGWNVFAERDASRESGKYSGVKKATYSKEDLRKIEEDYDREEIRGARPRYWEDVQVGDEFIPVVKGPLSMMDIICWLMGGGSPFLRAHGFALAYRRRHPKIDVGGEVAEAVHFDEGTAQEIGLQYAYDYGSQRISWLGHVLTNWMGDDAFLKRLQAKLVGFNMVGDTTWCKGKVIKKYEQEGEYLVDCQVWGENQRGQVTVTGEATIILPSRDKNLWPLDRRQ
jgi:acyl dehydratase